MSLAQNGIKQEKLTLLPEYDTNNPNRHDQIICDFTLKETLGKGTFGMVKLSTNIQTGEKVAIKIINESKIPKEQQLNFIREIEILKNLKHPNIIRLYSHVSKEKQLYLITEYIKGIELLQYVSLKKKIDEAEACLYFQQIISGLEFLHKMGIVHRDIKPENILVDHHLKEIKIIDFGLSNKYSDKSDLLSTLCGSPLYAAPEVLLGRGYTPRPVDIWSTGMVLYFMLSGRLPFEGEPDEELFKKIIEAKIKNIEGVSKEANDLIKCILNPNPKKRITIPKIKKHPWFNLFNNKSFKNISQYGLLISKYVIPIDEEIVSEIKNKFNIPEDEIRTDILSNKLNDITTLYYLIVVKKSKEGYKSISDFKSEKFIEYIKDENNLLKKYGNDVKRVIKMRKNGIEAEKQLKLEKSNSKNIKVLSLEKVSPEEKKELYRSLSPTMKNSRYELNYKNYNTQLNSPKIIKSFEFNEANNTNFNYKYLRPDTEVESIKAAKSDKYKKLLVKSHTNKLNINNKKKNISSPTNQKRKIGKNVSCNNYNKWETENKIINSNIKSNLTVSEKNILNKTEEKNALEEKSTNKKGEKNLKNNRNNIIKSNSKNNNDKKIKSARPKRILLLNDNEDKIINNAKKEKESQPFIPKTEVSSWPLQPIEELADKLKIGILEKNIAKCKINSNETSNSNNAKEREKLSPKFKNNNGFKINEDKNNSSKKQNKGLLYKKKMITKKSNNININSERKNKNKEIKISNVNNINNCLELNSSDNKNYNSFKNYLNTENNNNEERPNKSKINRYFSEELLDTKNKRKENNFKIKKHNTKKNDELLTSTNRHLNSPKNKIRKNLCFNKNFISMSNDDGLENKNINYEGFSEPFNLNNIYLKKKGTIKKELLQKFEKTKIKLKKLGNYNFLADFKNDISFELDIKENKKIGDNICTIKIKKLKGNNSSIFNCLKKILN